MKLTESIERYDMRMQTAKHVAAYDEQRSQKPPAGHLPQALLGEGRSPRLARLREGADRRSTQVRSANAPSRISPERLDSTSPSCAGGGDTRLTIGQRLFAILLLLTAFAVTCPAAEPADDIAQQALTDGNAVDGALVFYSYQLGCARCHSPSDPQTSPIGPDLATYPPDQRPSNIDLVEAITHPSKRIRRGFESYQLVTDDGRTMTGRILEKQAGVVTLQNSSGQITKFTEDEIEALRPSDLSTMPTGLAEQVGNRKQLINLVRYLIEIRDGGPKRAAELRVGVGPVVSQVADYESKIDHAALMQSAGKDVLKRGEAIYSRVCANCHGTLTEVGSLPNSLRFAEGKFKNGSDPYAMYRTMTYGFGMMTPQHWMVPKQKYAVIHYIRQHYLRDRNPSQWTDINEAYLAALPKGDSLGPEPSSIDPWNSMDYGPSLTHSYQVSAKPLNIAYKGLAIRLDGGAGGIARGDHWMLFDTDTLRWAAGWQADDGPNRFIDWKGIQFNGQHNIHPSIAGDVVFANANGPGWADPINQSFDDVARVTGRDNRRYGPLPKAWGKYLGQYRLGNSVVVAYQIGEAVVYEIPSYAPAVAGQHGSMFVRTLWIGARQQDLLLKVADLPNDASRLRCGHSGSDDILQWHSDDQQVTLKIKAGDAVQFDIGIARDERSEKATARQVTLDLSRQVIAKGTAVGAVRETKAEAALQHSKDAHVWLRGGPAAWTTTIATNVTSSGKPTDPFMVDTLQVPNSNPWAAQLRCTGVDFFSDGSIAVCTWDGDIWKVTEQSDASKVSTEIQSTLTWKRIASGLFQPLGIRIVQDQIYVTCRDQLTRLHDLNADGEIDFYECFNNDQQVTEHFHEFAMGLQRDDQGNFYYAKSARHALKAIVPHHGTLLKVSPDGQRTEIIANGFRAANGVCLNPDGSFFVTDQEGHWNPKNRINLVRPNLQGSPRFYGNMFGYSSVTDSSNEAMEKPLCWITNDFDRSPGELLWVDSAKWGALNGSLLELSYGTGRIYLVMQEKVGELTQGGMIALPIPDFPTGVMRGRFHPQNGHLYACGMFAWAGNAQQPGGFYRLRKTDAPLRIASQLHTSKTGIDLKFLVDLLPESVTQDNVSVKVWSLERTANYGSKHIDEKSLAIEKAELGSDGRSVHLHIPTIQPTWCMEIRYHFKDTEGQPVEGKIHNTIHELGQ